MTTYPETIQTWGDKTDNVSTFTANDWNTIKDTVEGLQGVSRRGRRRGFKPFLFPADSIDLTLTDANAKGFWGGFSDGKYLYCVPNGGGTALGKVARIDLSDFSTVSILDLTVTDADLKGFRGGFTDGLYGYFVPYSNGSYFGKVARVDLSDFSTVSVLNLATTDADLIALQSGFVAGKYAYFVPWFGGGAKNNGKIARLDLTDFSTVTVLDLTSTDANLEILVGCTDGNYAYFKPNSNSADLLARVDLSDFSTVTTLDLSSVNPGDVWGMVQDGHYGYILTPAGVCQVDLADFSTATLKLVSWSFLPNSRVTTPMTSGAPQFFEPAFDGQYVYIPVSEDPLAGIQGSDGYMARCDVMSGEILAYTLTDYDADLDMINGGVIIDDYLYLIPHASGTHASPTTMGKVAKIWIGD